MVLSAWSQICLRLDHNDHTNQVTTITMRKSLPLILLIAGLAIIGYGLMEKDDKQATIDLGKTEIDLGKKDSYFSPYFILGGIAAVAGIAMFATGKK